MKGLTVKVIRGFVKHFNLSKCRFPINVSKNQPLLKMSSKLYDDMLQVQEDMKRNCKSLLKKAKKMSKAL